jgi:hypothetical protein
VLAKGQACISTLNAITCAEIEAGQPAACADALMCQ